MRRNAPATGATAALLALLAPSAVPSAVQPAAQQAAPSIVPGIDAESPGPDAIARKARQDTFGAMQGLIDDICGSCRKPVGVPPSGNSAPSGNASPKCAGKKPRRTEDPPTLCSSPPADYIIAIIPDPVHTRLALYFDRLVEAVQQGLQDGGYQFVRAVIPWDHRTHSEPPLFESRLVAEAYEAEEAKLPGLMGFRTIADPRSGAASQYLLVLIVGESPTAGVVKAQFQSAVQWIGAASGRRRAERRVLRP